MFSGPPRTVAGRQRIYGLAKAAAAGTAALSSCLASAAKALPVAKLATISVARRLFRVSACLQGKGIRSARANVSRLTVAVA